MRMLYYLLLLLVIAVIGFIIVSTFNPTILDDAPETTLEKKEELVEEDILLKSLAVPAAIAVKEVTKPKPKKVVEPKPKPKPKPKKVYNGQLIYSNQCKLCHGNDKRFAQKFSDKKLRELFGKDGKKLAEIHEKSRVFKLTSKYFKDKIYKDQADSLRNYLIKIGKN